MISKTQKFWDKQAKKYDYSEREFDSVFKDVILRTKEYLSADDNVLDFGCATGTKTIELADSVKHIHGLDFSIEMINQANKKINERNLKNITFAQGDIFDNDYEKASFDKIISYGVIHLLNDSDKVKYETNCWSNSFDNCINWTYYIHSWHKKSKCSNHYEER